jgi:hypothetical protein
VAANDANNRRKVATRFPQIEETVAKWFNKHQHNVNMSGDLIKRKAESVRDSLGIPLEDFKASSGWLDGFKRRHGIKDRRRYGESGDVDMDLVENERPKIKAILDRFHWRDIYNMDETGLFFQREVGS